MNVKANTRAHLKMLHTPEIREAKLQLGQLIMHVHFEVVFPRWIKEYLKCYQTEMVNEVQRKKEENNVRWVRKAFIKLDRF
jgi:phenolic acid decarboxylase